MPEEDGHGPFVGEDGQDDQEVLAEIRVHGNAFITDKEVIDLAGVSPGQPFDEAMLQLVERRLKDSGRFESVDVRKRYRSCMF